MKLIFASQNKNKTKEINALLGNNFEVVNLTDLNFTQELEETGNTFNANAQQKAQFVFNQFNINCFADDSGLVVDALNGEPGVNSAFYAGPDKNYQNNNTLLLKNLSNLANRNAAFKTVICLIINNKTHFFEGVLNGIICTEPKGNNGFGYDPLFMPDGFTKTLAEMSIEEKNAISHRAIALNKMKLFLESNF